MPIVSFKQPVRIVAIPDKWELEVSAVISDAETRSSTETFLDLGKIARVYDS